MTTQQDYEAYQDLLVRLWDIDPEAAGYLADIANDMPKECGFDPCFIDISCCLFWDDSPQGYIYWRILYHIMECNNA